MGFFRSKKPSTPKGNTIKKPEQTEARQLRGDVNADKKEKDTAVVDASTVGAWIEEGKGEGPKSAQGDEQAVLRTLTRSCRATLRDTSTTRSYMADDDDSKPIEPEGQPQISTNDKDHEPRQEMVSLLLGVRNPASQYFVQRFVQASATSLPILANFLSQIHFRTSAGEESDKYMSLEDVDPGAFEIYRIWLHTGIISSREQVAHGSSSKLHAIHTWRMHWPLMNAHTLGYTIGAPAFSDHVLDILLEKVERNVCADVYTIEHLFSASPGKISESLKRFVVDRCIDAGVETASSLNMPELPPAFAHSMLEAALRRLAPETGPSAPQEAGCTYHIHDTPAMCYKKHIPAADQRRAKRCGQEREQSLKDSKEVTKHVEVNDIRFVDWEQRRIEAARALKEQTGKGWVGFSRPGQSQPGIAQTMDGTLSEDLVHTTQTLNGDDVWAKAPSRKTPPPLHTNSPQTLAAITSQSPDNLAISQATVLGPDRSASPALSLCSAQSKPDSELRTNFETALKYERQSACPGAFPISREGSLLTSNS
ncbi:hypothetical protein CC86DRAFT_156592 [Ophiobolus disseminans]|uniref:BTB domain-containing protein n=1 Tax=Ophiobolus disseminans TaxID=1469910 RepID=A0A6A6ZBZ0_9PLEO|nr:hypothetical protein CC86DRAFT_156592 [Ophiobolus disseminans]